jgi:hypothetical protein
MENVKIKIITFQMLAHRGPANNEMFLLKNQKTCKSTHTHTYNVPLVEVSAQVCYKLDFTPMALCVPLPSSDTVVLSPKLYFTHREYPVILDLN